MTRRTVERRPRFKPHEEVAQLLGYALGRAVGQNSGARLHAFTQPTTHVHERCIDVPGAGGHSALPRLRQRSFGRAARAIGARSGRGGALFQQDRHGNVEDHDRAALEQQLVYTGVQVVKDGIVDRLEDWPGVLVLPDR